MPTPLLCAGNEGLRIIVSERIPSHRPVESGSGSGEIPLVPWVTCPHCWHDFRPEDSLWVSQHEDLMGDPVLKEEPLRFLPTHFNLEGQALDARGMVCHSLACPNCHLVIPRLLLENPVAFFSIIGSVGSGKSNFLASMAWELRQQMAQHFAIMFADGDKEANWILNRYEETLFLPDDPDRPVVLDKTRTQGDLYRSVRINGQETQLPKPFLFSLHPAAEHPLVKQRSKLGSILCLYDNAGEHYSVGQDTALSPVTRHLSKSRVLMFLFDPTQDPRFRQRCKGISHDPQITDALQTVRQESILSEAALRVRRHAGLSAYQRYQVPLLILVGKSDIWGSLLDEDITTEPIVFDSAANGTLASVDLDRIEQVSKKLRALLLRVAPEVVTVAEDFCEEVFYIPVSALGGSPEKKADSSGLFVKPRDVHPHWVTAPMLYSYARWSSGLIHGLRSAVASS